MENLLKETTPARYRERILADRVQRLAAKRQSKAELDAHYARLVADRKRRLGW